MLAQLVVRAMTGDRQIVAWARIAAIAKGDGCLYPIGGFNATAERDGDIEILNIHWPDLNIHTTIPLNPPRTVALGDHVNFEWGSFPIMTIQSNPTPLPPVTERQSVSIGVPTGASVTK